MARFFIDCEWNEFRGQLISMALVGEDGAEWYEVTHCANVGRWVTDHVLPILGKKPITWEAMQASLQAFLAPHESVEIVADWPEDIEHFCNLLITGPGLRIDTPPLCMRVVRIDAPSKLPHNALEDARGIRDALRGAPKSTPPCSEGEGMKAYSATINTQPLLGCIPQQERAWVYKAEEVDAEIARLSALLEGVRAALGYDENEDLDQMPGCAATQMRGLAHLRADNEKRDDHFMNDTLRANIAALADENDALRAKLAATEQSLLCPGVMRCAKCEFELTRITLYMGNGAVGPGDSATEPCPNGCGPLWPVTWEARARDAIATSERFFDEAQEAKTKLAAMEADGERNRNEYGWLVEDSRNHPSGIRYRMWGDLGPEWTNDANKALRFARRQDAEAFCRDDEDAWHVVEHMWPADAARQQEDAKS